MILSYYCHIFSVDCGEPERTNFNVLHFLSHNSTVEGSIINYHCTNGFIPEDTITATCETNGTWHPNPAFHDCVRSKSNTTLSNSNDSIETGMFTLSVYAYNNKSVIIIMCALDLNQQNCVCDQRGRLSLADLLIVVICCAVVVSTVAFAFGIICGTLVLKKKVNDEQQSALPDPVYEQVSSTTTQAGIELNDNVAYSMSLDD